MPSTFALKPRKASAIATARKMREHLHQLTLHNYKTETGKTYPLLPLSYEAFGCPLGESPVVLVNHAMTANSTVTGPEGWWSPLVGAGKVIDTDRYTVLAFNIPGNGYDGYLVKHYEDFTVRDVARIFLSGLRKLGVRKLFAAIGGSVGGALAWEIAVLEPDAADHIIPVASDWKATDWLLANLKIQTQILQNSTDPLGDARMHAMNFYRSPQSYKAKFHRSQNEVLQKPNVETWLEHHAEKLKSRFTLPAYKLMNHLVSTIDITKGRGSFEEAVAPLKSAVHMVGVDSDLFFMAQENIETLAMLKKIGKTASYTELKSIHGHDAFLIEFDQLEAALAPVFRN